MNCILYRISGKAAIGYSYGDSVADDYNISDNDSDVESIHEEEGLFVCAVCVRACVCARVRACMRACV